jgi:sulfatase maturation enzyme AslB (radical SAM superfamily)
MNINGERVIASGLADENDINVNFNWMLTDLCNYKCRYCFAGYGHDTTRPVSKLKKQHIRYAWKTVLPRLCLKTIPKFQIDLVGGEPTLHPDIKTIVYNILELPNLDSLILTTNLSKPLSFFTDFPSVKKFIINISYHDLYANEHTLEKIINLNNTHNINVQIMLTDDPDFVCRVENIVKVFEQHNIRYAGLYLFQTQTYKPNYTQDVIDKYDKLFTNQKKYRYVTTDNIHYVTERDIMFNKLNLHKGWSCVARTWEIKTDGEIVNMCTRSRADTTLKDITKSVVCPHSKCECVGFWNYTKYDNTDNRS